MTKIDGFNTDPDLKDCLGIIENNEVRWFDE